MITHDAVQILADRDDIHDVVMSYADGVDRRDMERVRACFAPDLDVVAWGGGFADRDSMIEYITGVAIFHTTMHMFGNQYIEVDGDRAHVDTYAMLTHHRDDAGGATRELNISRGLYVEDLTRREGRWVITRRGGDPIWAPAGTTDVTTDDPATQWLLDRAEIHDLMMQYALGVDLRDYDRIRKCFASSFRASYRSREFTDADELIEFISGVEHFPSTTHFLGTQLIDVDGDEAWAETYSLVTHRPDDDDPSSDWVAAGQYVDRLVRECGRWRIAERGPSARRPRPAAPTTATTDDPRVQRLIDRAAIHDVIVDSALAMDRERVSTRHFLNNELVAIEGDEATVETYVYVTEQQEDGRPSPWSKAPRRWLDHVRRVDGRWVLDHRREESTRVADDLLISAEEAAVRAANRRSRDG